MRKKILIVEQEVAVGEALERRLLARGYDPTRVTEAEEALRRFDEARPDLVILSLTLAGDAGRTICRSIRTRPLGALVPILFLGSGREEVRSVSEAIAAGADHFFRKPEGLDDLLTKVVTYIGPGDESGRASPEPVAPSLGALDTPALTPASTGDGFYRTIRDVLATRPTPPPPANWEEVTRQSPTPPPQVPEPSAPEAIPPALLETAELVAWRPPTVPEPPPRPATPPWPAAAPPEPEPTRPPGLPAQASLPATGPLPPLAEEPRLPPAPLLPPLARAPLAREMAEPESVLEPGRPLDLEVRGVSELLAAAATGNVNGRLEVAAAGVLRRVFFEGGLPIYADSSEPSEDLGAWLAAEGRITRSALADARERAAALGSTAEQILIEAGYLRPDDVYRALRGHVLERVLALFALESGEAVFLRAGARAVDPVDLGLHPGRLILDGIRRKYGRLRLYRVFGTPGLMPRPGALRNPPPGLSLRPDEAQMLTGVDGRRTVLELARALQMGEIDALAILYGLAVLGLVERPAPGRGVGALPPLDPDSVARATGPRTDDQMPGFPELVATKYAEVSNADYFQVLGVPRHATGAEVRAAWERLHRQFDPHRVRRESPLWHQVREVAAVVDDAYAILGSERLRERYQANLE